MIGVELFAGAGGMSLGAEMAGINVKYAVEKDSFAAKTFSYNLQKTKVLTKDVKEITDVSIKSNKDQRILFGGPPCKGFSKSNLRTRNSDNKNNWLFKEFLRITKSWMPDWILLENVYGLLGTENGLFIREIKRDFENLGYIINYSVLNAKNFGVPQNRERVFIVGSLNNYDFTFPESHSLSHITVKEAFHDLPVLLNGEKSEWKNYPRKPKYEYAKLMRGNLNKSSNHNVSRNRKYVVDRYRYIPQGGNWKDIPTEIMNQTYKDSSRCHTGIYHRLNENSPSVVIGNYRKNMLIHPNQDRGLSVREAARLQSFPDSFRFIGNLGNQQQQVGNAVPPLLAKAVFNKIISYL